MLPEYKKADARNPKMGLFNKTCKNPVYWCRSHEVYLSPEDVEKKKCLHKSTFDMIGQRICGNLEKVEGK